MADSKKYNGSTWEHSLRKLTTATADIEPTIYTDGTTITAYTIKGNTVQNGTPTPSNPVDVQGVGNKTANLLDYTKSETGGIDASGNLIDSYNLWRSTVYTPIDNSKNYTISFQQVSNLSKVRVNYYQADKTHISRQEFDALSVDEGQLVIPNNAAFIKWTLYALATINISFVASINLMLNEGTTALDYEPYGFKIPIPNGQQTIEIYIGDLPLFKSLDGTAVDEISNGTLTRRVDSDGSVLPTTTTTQITMPSIPTTQGANSITVDTTVQPSEFTATWTGWHSANVKEWDGSQWNE